jgi:uncharacterized protein DUF6220
MRSTYRILAMLIAIGVILQAAFIAWGLFAVVHNTDDGQTFDKNTDVTGFSLHSAFGDAVIPLLALLLLIVSFFARIPGGVKWAAITFGVMVLQVVLAFAGRGLPLIGLLHGINAFALATVASLAMRKANQSPAAEPVAPVGA